MIGKMPCRYAHIYIVQHKQFVTGSTSNRIFGAYCMVPCHVKSIGIYYTASKWFSFKKVFYRNASSVILPFDSLSMQMSPLLHRKIAELYSRQWNQHSTAFEVEHEARARFSLNDTKLRIAYLSYDFSDHPTSHLMEGIFNFHNQSTFFVSAYSYGKGWALVSKIACDSNFWY